MNHDNNFKRIAITPSDFNKMVEAFNSLQHNETIAKTMESFIEDKNFYIDYSIKKKALPFDLKVFDDFVTNIHLENFGFPSRLKTLQNKDIELIKNFFNGDLVIFSTQEDYRQPKLNIFGEMISSRLTVQDKKILIKNK